MNELNKVRTELAYELLRSLINTQTPFRIVLWTMDDWDMPLPKDILSRFPEQLVLDITDESLSDSYVNNNEIVLSTGFEEDKYTKIVKKHEIVALTDLKGNPMLVNNFKSLVTPEKGKGLFDIFKVFECIKKDTPEKNYENVIKSLNAFQKNNKDLF